MALPRGRDVPRSNGSATPEPPDSHGEKSLKHRNKSQTGRRDGFSAGANINLNKSFPFIRKFEAYSLQIWRKLNRPRQRWFQSCLLTLTLQARDVPQGIGCHVLSVANDVLARAGARAVAERRLTTARQSSRPFRGDLRRVRHRRRSTAILRAPAGRLYGRFPRCQPARLARSGRRADAV